MERIEFYRNRTLSERFSVSVDFLKQNWKVLYKNILIGAIPLGIVVAFLAQYYQESTLLNIYSGNVNTTIYFIALYIVFAVILNIYLNAMTGAVLKKYGEGHLTPATGWSDLSRTMLSLSGKTFVIGLLICGVIIVFALILALIFSFLADGGTLGAMVVTGAVMFILCIVLIAFLPSLSLTLFPAYFSGTGNRKSLKIAFGMGFRNWGNVFVTILLAGIILYVIIVIFSAPKLILALFSPGEIGVLTFLSGFLAILGNILTYPVFFIFIAFQYFSIVESEQSLSLQSKVDEFENL
ncbi:MAG: hypothetical protein LBS08_02215 [Candidatus Symbiothrix sp.]|jgi:hypothetical protein|nr:hypothetical protein [Candidatus Symbiothrix sp.]